MITAIKRVIVRSNCRNPEISKITEYLRALATRTDLRDQGSDHDHGASPGSASHHSGQSHSGQSHSGQSRPGSPQPARAAPASPQPARAVPASAPGDSP
jgi:hypothetical protein